VPFEMAQQARAQIMDEAQMLQAAQDRAWSRGMQEREFAVDAPYKQALTDQVRNAPAEKEKDRQFDMQMAAIRNQFEMGQISAQQAGQLRNQLILMKQEAELAPQYDSSALGIYNRRTGEVTNPVAGGTKDAMEANRVADLYKQVRSELAESKMPPEVRAQRQALQKTLADRLSEDPDDALGDAKKILNQIKIMGSQYEPNEQEVMARMQQYGFQPTWQAPAPQQATDSWGIMKPEQKTALIQKYGSEAAAQQAVNAYGQQLRQRQSGGR
jgi:hypothetical protein